MLRPRFVIIELDATVLELADAENARRTAFGRREVGISCNVRGRHLSLRLGK
jgi:hypothetical protein